MAISMEDLKDCYYHIRDDREYGFSIIDFVHPVTGLTVYGGKTAEQVQAEYPGAKLAPWDKVNGLQEAYYRRPVSEITKSRFWQALECLPPVGWRNDGEQESFKISERTCGNITNIYARFGSRYFALADSIYTKHDDIMQKVRDFITDGATATV